MRQAGGLRRQGLPLDAEIEMPKAKGTATELANLERQRREIAHCTDEG